MKDPIIVRRNGRRLTPDELATITLSTDPIVVRSFDGTRAKGTTDANPLAAEIDRRLAKAKQEQQRATAGRRTTPVPYRQMEPGRSPTRDWYNRVQELRELPPEQRPSAMEWEVEKRLALAAGADPVVVRTLGMKRPDTLAQRKAELELVDATLGIV